MGNVSLRFGTDSPHSCGCDQGWSTFLRTGLICPSCLRIGDWSSIPVGSIASRTAVRVEETRRGQDELQSHISG